ncbi:MAG: hypothetical protein COS71_03655 [Candidatus Moranbacteria bacterium CG06_land_8_20_14_3_00_40_12]|nr:MAG: hypothetical protein COS71_03655 [Candidatus Moranbacteria bacterium CG06_land_8_20_14_3_00_40_12]
MRENFKKNEKKGYSLLEVMLVIFILGTALVVFVQVISKSIIHSMDSRDTIIASELAQEGVELTINIRDNNWAQKLEDFSGIDNGSHAINYNGGALISLGTGKLRWSGSYYNTSSGSETKFSRKIIVDGDADVKKITSLVVWERNDFPPDTTSCHAANKCAYAEVNLTKWGN